MRPVELRLGGAAGRVVGPVAVEPDHAPFHPPADTEPAGGLQDRVVDRVARAVRGVRDAVAEPARDRLRCAAPKISIRSRHSRRTVPIRRSAYPFCQGDLGEIGRSRIPMALSREVKTCP